MRRSHQIAGFLLWVYATIMTPVISHSDETSVVPNGIDHLLYATTDLEKGMDEIESLLGVRPVPGGHHPKYGTHNALLSLGPGVYLEIIARDPKLPAPQRGPLIDIALSTESHLVTWVYRVEDIQEASSAVASASIELGPIESGSRAKPDGSVINWQLTDPYSMPLEGAVPFLINWGETVHPHWLIPSGGRLVEVAIEHPEPDRVREALSTLGVEINVIAGGKYRLSAKIATEAGIVTLR